MAPKIVLDIVVFSGKRTIRSVTIIRVVSYLKVLGNDQAVIHFKIP